MDQAAELSRSTVDPWLHFSITGGEPFLDLALLEDAIAHGHRLGAEISCVTNGYWSSSDAKTRSILQRLMNAGLSHLSVSSSRFHEQFVKRSRVQRALRIARELGLKCQMKRVQTGEDGEPTGEWTEADVQIIPLAPSLREGATVPLTFFPRRDKVASERCPASAITVFEDGNAYPCCSPGAAHPFFSLGDIRSSSLGQMRDRFHFGGKHLILREHGPSYFVRAIEQKGQDHLLRSSYSDVCDLCTHIAREPTLSRIATAAAVEFEVQELRGLLVRPRGERGLEANTAVPLSQGDSA